MKFARIKLLDGTLKEIPVSGNKRILRDIIADGRREVTYFEKEFPKFVFDVWVHPKNGGDDRQVQIEYECSNLEIAKSLLKKYLARVSDVTNDYRLIIK